MATPDKSVRFVVIGFKSNMRDLLQSKPDEISPLSGIELVRRKVALVSDMGGRYPTQKAKDSFNFRMVEGAADYYVEHWPTPMIFAGVGTGGIKVGMRLRKEGMPVGRAMDLKLKHGWKPGETYQAGFDLASVLVASRAAFLPKTSGMTDWRPVLLARCHAAALQRPSHFAGCSAARSSRIRILRQATLYGPAPGLMRCT